ncbi:putative membrane-associated zinc metalloprotease [Psychromonas sp. CNPT3]|uniref:sigma E protease regulator RseP n=1 Tax=Psychromonas sp. CNPT3 TaxID=314282 RepID=UPI0002C147CA|nr:sigma E protease regulator RseP [Psychromonas sp. CNPT3]AGH81980.1 putative membrane-associated zinc metalloprotease [Psychromonas sp. CNPT3]
MLAILWNLGAFMVALSILVAIHEFGHFWVARRCGVKVHCFSIGFGKTLFKHTDKLGTEFIFALIPLGGYVKMLDSRIETVSAQELQYAFDKKTVWQRIAIVAAGPIANFLLAIIAFFFMFMIGINTAKPIISTVAPDTPMSVLETQAPFQIVSVNDKLTAEWDSLHVALLGEIGQESIKIGLRSLNDGALADVSEPLQYFTVSLTHWKYSPKKESIVTSLGLQPYRPSVHLKIASIMPDSAAFKAGLKEQDKLLSVNNEPLETWSDFVKIIQNNAGTALQLQILRGALTQTINLVPASRENASGETQGYVGIMPVIEAYPEEFRVSLKYSAPQAFIKGVQKTAQLTSLTFSTLTKLVSGDISIKSLSGPVGIAKGAGMSATYGIQYFLGFLALISVNLGLMNLIPLPVLDGGHLLYYAVEIITGKPVPEKIQEIGFRIGGAILMLLMSIAILNDFNLLS